MEKTKNPSLLGVDCVWPDSVRDEYNAIGANAIPDVSVETQPLRTENDS